MPAAGFALLLADLVMRGSALAAARLPRRAAQVLTALVVAVLVGRFATFAGQGVAEFRQLARPYDRFAAAVQTASRSPTASGEIRVTPGDVANIPAIYYDAAAETALCTAGVRVVVEAWRFARTRRGGLEDFPRQRQQDDHGPGLARPRAGPPEAPGASRRRRRARSPGWAATTAALGPMGIAE